MTEEELMLTTIRKCRRTDLYAERRALTDEEQGQLAAMKAARVKSEPLQYILGECDFLGLPLHVDRRVLIPRPETEILVDAVLTRASGRGRRLLRILDLGTGSGNIAISLAKFLPRVRLTAVDISPAALSVARQNARQQNVENRIEFFQRDMIAFLRAPVSEPFDIIVSNPPYVASSAMDRLPRDVQKEPRVALDGGEDGFKFLRPLAEEASHWLAAEGFLALEIGDGQSAALQAVFDEEDGYGEVEFLKDYTGTDRIAVAPKCKDVPEEKPDQSLFIEDHDLWTRLSLKDASP